MRFQILRVRPAARGLALALVLLALPAGAALAQSAVVTQQDVEQWMTSLSNWGRWGANDELGAINLITPEKRRQAAGLVRAGVSVSLARDVEKEKAADNSEPFLHEMTRSGLDETQFSIDRYSVSYHGYAHTHMDSLCHMFHGGKMFNGFAQTEVTPRGAGKLAVLNFKSGIFTRGILMDMARLKGVEYLEPGTAIYPADLEAWEKQAGVKVSSGDVIFVRTGRWALRDAKGPWPASEKSAGLFASCARWLKERDVAAIGSDAASDVMPSGVEGVSQPIHLLVLVAMGTPIFDNCDLEAVSREAARQRRWEFLLTAAPLAVGGGTGSPLNPIATF
jgi:kynurenine formamidase